MPKISVVMPVYNGERFLQKALESILAQSFKDFEFIIINDGSTDQSEEIISLYDDPRIVYLENDKNMGLSYSLNRGIAQAKGKYIARMDADDISLPNRLSSQLRFLENHKEVGIIGTAIKLIDESGRIVGKARKPASHFIIKWQCLFSTPLFHPTVMARAEVLKENRFDETLSNSEDYELWSRLIFEKDIKFANLPRPLLFYRSYKSSFTQSLDTDKKINSAENTIRNIERYMSLNEKEKNLIGDLKSEKVLPVGALLKIYQIYLRAQFAFKKKERLSLREFLSIHLMLHRFQIWLLKYYAKGALR